MYGVQLPFYSVQLSPCLIWLYELTLTDAWLSRYIISNCSPVAKLRILRSAQGGECQSLFRAMMIDTFLLDATAHVWKHQLLITRQNLVKYVSLSPRMTTECCRVDLTMTRSTTARRSFLANLWEKVFKSSTGSLKGSMSCTRIWTTTRKPWTSS